MIDRRRDGHRPSCEVGTVARWYWHRLEGALRPKLHQLAKSAFLRTFCCEPWTCRLSPSPVSMSQYFPPPFHEPDDHQDIMQPPSPHQHIFSVYISWQVSLHSGQKSTFGTCCWSTSTSTTTATIVEESNVDIKLMRDIPHLTL